MEKKNLDWANLGFSYIKTDFRYVAEYKNGAWGEGKIITDDQVHMSEAANVLQYSQSCFEGMKAYTTPEGKIVTFRPDMNAQRMFDTAKRLEMPPFPTDRFIEAVDKAVAANAAWVPPYGTGATLYIRPVMVATTGVIGLHPAEEYEFRVFVLPVGPYFKDGQKPIAVKVSDFDRAAPNGTGNIKAGLNYAMSLHPTELALKEGFTENVYLDSATRTYVEETGGTNLLFVDRDGTLVVPQSFTDSILPSITRKSIVHVAKEYLKLNVVERPVKMEEVAGFAEMAVCGTASVICPVGCVNDHGKEIRFPYGMEKPGEITEKLYETLTAIQRGEKEAPAGWVHEVALG